MAYSFGQMEASLEHVTTGPVTAPGRQDSERAGVTILCEVRQGTTRPWLRARLEDLSPKGFRIAWMPNVSENHPLRIRIPGMQSLTAHVRWRQGKTLGCEFSETLHFAVFEHLVRQASV